jgi:hypothetical protein
MTSTQTPLSDDDLRALLAPLAASEPEPRERARVSAVAGPQPQPRRRPAPGWRPVAAVAATTAAVGAGLALLPADRTTTATRHGTPAGALAFLRATAAVAAEQPAPAGPWRYVRLRETITYRHAEAGRVAEDHHEQLVETWVSGRWDGREIAARGRRWITGDPSAAAALNPDGSDAIDKPRDHAYAYGDGPLAGLDPADLPEDRDGIAAALRARIARYAKATTASPGSLTAYSIINLLVAARLSPQQRAALLDVLARDPHAQDLGTVKDAEGRAGRGIALAYDGPQMLLGVGAFRVVFDPGTSEVREWSLAPPASEAAGGMGRTETILAAGYAPAAGERP